MFVGTMMILGPSSGSSPIRRGEFGLLNVHVLQSTSCYQHPRSCSDLLVSFTQRYAEKYPEMFSRHIEPVLFARDGSATDVSTDQVHRRSGFPAHANKSDAASVIGRVRDAGFRFMLILTDLSEHDAGEFQTLMLRLEGNYLRTRAC
jgi:hypothetical protein